MTLKKFATQIPYKNFWRALLKVVLLIAAIILVGKIFPTFAGTVLCLLMLGGYYGAFSMRRAFAT